MADYAIGSKCNHKPFRDRFAHWAGARGRVRFHSALAEYWTLSRRTDTRDLRGPIAAECFLHGAGERRRFQIDRLWPDMAADFRRSADGIDRCDRSFYFKSERYLRRQR